VNTKYRYLRLTDAEIVAFSKKSIPYWDFYIFSLFCTVGLTVTGVGISLSFDNYLCC
jgi:hypothetical protein